MESPDFKNNKLWVAATTGEISAFSGKFGLTELRMGVLEPLPGGDMLLVTGIGMTNTAYFLGAAFARHRFSLAIHLGVAGSFRRDWDLGKVVEVRSEAFGELGAESPEGFLNLEALGFPLFENDGVPVGNVLVNPQRYSDLEQAKGLTVNRVHGTAPSIEDARQLWDPDIESMEGAAFFQACQLAKVPHVAFRAISNYVEPRNRENWRLDLAVKELTSFALEWRASRN